MLFHQIDVPFNDGQLGWLQFFCHYKPNNTSVSILVYTFAQLFKYLCKINSKGYTYFGWWVFPNSHPKMLHEFTSHGGMRVLVALLCLLICYLLSYRKNKNQNFTKFNTIFWAMAQFTTANVPHFQPTSISNRSSSWELCFCCDHHLSSAPSPLPFLSLIISLFP